MKDYKLSEIKAICEGHRYCNEQCPFYTEACEETTCLLMAGHSAPNNWQIDEEEQDDDGE